MKELGISLPRFQGPLDLLLSLVRRNQLDLADLPVAEVTRQYLDYVRQADELDVNLGAEYADMAATLIQLKSRLLLPTDPEVAAREPDPRQELVRQLMDYDLVRQAAEFLQQKLEIATASWSRPSAPDEVDVVPGRLASEAPSSTVNLLEVLRLARRALATAKIHESVDTKPDSATTELMSAWIDDQMMAIGESQTASLLRWFENQLSAARKMALFAAVLEQVRIGRLSLMQDDPFGDVWLTRRPNGTSVP